MNESKQFWKAFDGSSPAYKLQIEERDDDLVGVTVYHPDLSVRGMNVDAAQAAAVALAILEAAGVEPKPLAASNAVEIALAYLHEHVGAEAAKAKEAADREALEGEAWVFYVSSRVGNDVIPYASMGEMDPSVKARWIAVARKARELHGAKS